MPNASTPTTTAKTPKTLRECLAPLAAGALETSLLAYQWGLENHCLMRASSAMDLAGSVIKEANAMLAHETSAFVTADLAAKQEFAK